jgi:hypothetical protein
MEAQFYTLGGGELHGLAALTLVKQSFVPTDC